MATNPLLGYTPPPQNQRNSNADNANTLKSMLLCAFGFLPPAIVVVVLILSMTEDPPVPMRLWLVVYALLYCVQIFIGVIINPDYPNLNLDGQVINDISEKGKFIIIAFATLHYIWVFIGLYWVLSGDQMLVDNAPKLGWLSAIILGFEIGNIVRPIIAGCYRGIRRAWDER